MTMMMSLLRISLHFKCDAIHYVRNFTTFTKFILWKLWKIWHFFVSVTTVLIFAPCCVHGCSRHNTTFEALCIRFTAGNSSWLLLSIYRPGSSRVTSTFFDELSSTLEILAVHGCLVVVGGDLNVHVEDPPDASAALLSDLFPAMD